MVPRKTKSSFLPLYLVKSLPRLLNLFTDVQEGATGRRRSCFCNRAGMRLGCYEVYGHFAPIQSYFFILLQDFSAFALPLKMNGLRVCKRPLVRGSHTSRFNSGLKKCIFQIPTLVLSTSGRISLAGQRHNVV